MSIIKKIINSLKKSMTNPKTYYLIEFRFTGKAKKTLKDKIWHVSKKFKVKGVTAKRVVPHITLFGPFHTKQERKMIDTVQKVCQKYEFINFELTGFGRFDERVIYVNIKPSNQLIQLRKELFEELSKISITNHTDFLDEFKFHATIAFKDIGNKFDKIWDYLNKTNPPKMKQTLLRATILKKSKILYEYDFMQKRMLNRKQALNRKITQKTINILKSKKTKT